MTLNLLTRHNQCRIISKVLRIMLMCIRRIGRSVKVLEKRFEVRIEVELGGFEVVVTHFDK